MAMANNLAKLYSAEIEGVLARLIEIEVDLNVGLHAFNIVGLADKALNEARERVNSALKNSGVKPPNRENRKITVNLAPADVKKAGSQYDLALALGYLLATKQIKEFEVGDKIFIGELALDGRLRPVNGALNIAQMAERAGFKYIFLPKENANEAAAIIGAAAIPVATLTEAIDILEERCPIVPAVYSETRETKIDAPDFSEIKGQEHAKRALIIAAAGGHNVLMIGPPGVGKSLLARALTGILPGLSREEAIEITKVWSAAGRPTGGLVRHRPFRAPHQTASLVAVVGGGSDPRPGEISLAHRGILFLDEVPDFQKNILEALRQPLEDGVVHVARAKNSLAFPAKFNLVAAMNPCPCGFYGDSEKECRCSAYEVIRYQKKISGPLLDRIDLQIKVPRIPLEELRVRTSEAEKGASMGIKASIEGARAVQAKRFKKLPIHTNGEMSSRQTEELSALEPSAESFLETLGESRLSPRGYYRLLKVARTIADLDSVDTEAPTPHEGRGPDSDAKGAERDQGVGKKVSAEHLAEAFSYRLKEEV